MFEQIVLVISNFLQILGLQPRISNIFLDHQNNFFSQQVRTILVTKYHLRHILQIQIDRNLKVLLQSQQNHNGFKLISKESFYLIQLWFRPIYDMQPYCQDCVNFHFVYRTHAIITGGLYTFYPLFEVQKRFFKVLFS